MAMIYSLHDSIDAGGDFDMVDFRATSVDEFISDGRESHSLVKEKLRRPAVNDAIERPRLMTLLDRSARQFPTTLICGRAGTGKTTLAAGFAAAFDNAYWYSVDSTDAEWNSFSRYFAACIGESTNSPVPSERTDGTVDQSDIARFLLNIFVNTYDATRSETRLIVIDDIHHLFDAAWFDDFFNLLLYSIPSKAHLLLLCRSKPPNPLWRLRSKQMLNVLDEKVIAFDPVETESLFEKFGLSASAARDAQRKYFGRASKLAQLGSTA